MPPEQQVRLLLVDDHGLFRESLGRLLKDEDAFELTAEAATVSEGMRALSNQIDVVLLDFDLGDQTGIDFLTLARAQSFTGRILVVTAGLSDLDTLRVMELGAAGIFLKHHSPADLIAAIRKVVKGQTCLDEDSVDVLVTAATTSKADTHQTLLSPKQRDVLKAVFEGLTNKEISTRMGISETYVKALLQQLFSKTGVRSRSQLVRIALEDRSWHGIEFGSPHSE